MKLRSILAYVIMGLGLAGWFITALLERKGLTLLIAVTTIVLAYFLAGEE